MKKIRSDNLFGDIYEHSSFGQLTFSSGQGPAQPLFGSSILHRNTIRIEITHAEYNRHTGTEYIFGTDIIVEAIMSHTQFADAITGLGSGQGVPITLRFVKGGEQIPPPEFVSKRKQFESEFYQTAGGIMKRLTDLEKKVGEKKLPKWVSFEIDIIKSWLKSNIPFLAEQFSEQMDKTVTEAKGEVEGYVSNLVRRIGLETIKHQAPQITEGEPKKRKRRVK